MGQIIFQLLSCLYLYDSGIQLPVLIRKQVGIPTSDAWRCHTVPLVYRLLTPQGSLRKAGIPASDVLRVNLCEKSE